MDRCTAGNWKYQLPWVLLGLRTTPRANDDPSKAEKFYGESLVVPGELITQDRDNLTAQKLRDRVGKFAPCQRTYTDRTSPFMPPGLSSTTHVFLWNDAVHPPLTRPYRGPFLALERNKKAFWVAIHGKDDWVSIDRLKPAILEEDVNGTPQAPLQETSPHPPTLLTRKSHGCPWKGLGPGRESTNHSRTQHARVERTPHLASRSRVPLRRPSRYLP
ncbi:uncharacterized protein [Macrobrachium rosenbergii]|uniref:uncharacterized protein n=1 Tax=Macrobrachium rosenbergii TaxID=79674 RepID=UPI0034D56414